MLCSWGHMGGWGRSPRVPGHCRYPLPSWKDVGLHPPSQWTPLSLTRSSTHLPILKLLQAVDLLKGPHLDSLRLLDQLRVQDWEEEAGKGGLTFNHLKVGGFCWWDNGSPSRQSQGFSPAPCHS